MDACIPVVGQDNDMLSALSGAWEALGASYMTLKTPHWLKGLSFGSFSSVTQTCIHDPGEMLT